MQHCLVCAVLNYINNNYFTKVKCLFLFFSNLPPVEVQVYWLSFMWYCALGVLVSYVTGLLASLLTGNNTLFRTFIKIFKNDNVAVFHNLNWKLIADLLKACYHHVTRSSPKFTVTSKHQSTEDYNDWLTEYLADDIINQSQNSSNGKNNAITTTSTSQL